MRATTAWKHDSTVALESRQTHHSKFSRLIFWILLTITGAAFHSTTASRVTKTRQAREMKMRSNQKLDLQSRGSFKLMTRRRLLQPTGWVRPAAIPPLREPLAPPPPTPPL